MSDKTVKKFKGDGNQKVGHRASDLVIKFKQTPHDRFKRAGDNLILT
jgi:DnaJ-class molecular chaperone